jgi:hypothetical protein
VVVSVVVVPEVAPAAPLRPVVVSAPVVEDDAPLRVVPAALLPVVPLPIVLLPEVPLPIVLLPVPAPVALLPVVPLPVVPLAPVLDEPDDAGPGSVAVPCVWEGFVVLVLPPELPEVPPPACANARPVAVATTAAAMIAFLFMSTPT